MKEQLQKLLERALTDLEKAESMNLLEQLKVQYLGKKSELVSLLRGMKELAAEERPKMGELANSVRTSMESAFDAARERLFQAEQQKKLAQEQIDVTLPAENSPLGHRHPLSIIQREIEEIFLGMGFEIAEGPEVEYDYYNFTALNTPPDHPARDTQDTFYITPDVLLRSQTSTVQVRTMEQKKPPIRVISPGRVYRSDAVDATHSPMFHQVEGLVVDRGVTMGDLKGTLEIFAQNTFGKESRIRFRPHHFPFTEPSCEVDVSCFVCGGKGCSLCKGEGFIEILGAGMVHPNVLRGCNIDPEVYSGFAFGAGIERVAMLKYGIDDMRLFYENDLRFLRQFS